MLQPHIADSVPSDRRITTSKFAHEVKCNRLKFKTTVWGQSEEHDHRAAWVSKLSGALSETILSTAGTWSAGYGDQKGNHGGKVRQFSYTIIAFSHCMEMISSHWSFKLLAHSHLSGLCWPFYLPHTVCTLNLCESPHSGWIWAICVVLSWR